MKNRCLAIFFFFIITVSTVFAQESRRPTCGTTQYMEALIASDPGVASKLAEIENATSELRASNISRNSSGQAIITIPTVVHVVYNGAAQNISDSRIFAQINVLNEDFGRMNADTVNTPAVFKHLGADTEIRFELAKRDPDGFATTGITRTQTSVSSFTTDNKVKYDATGGKNVWNRNQYLNIWVCNLSSLLLGYAQFPGLSAATDGVVIDYQYFGTFGASFPYNKGRTATHEIGHWLNLRHIWGDSFCGNDFVNDTPVQADDNFGCPSFPQVSSCTGNPPNGDMFMNYMDYTDDRCMNIFTQGQKTRMNDAILIARLSLLTSPGLLPPSTGIDKLFTQESVNIYPNPARSEVNIQLPAPIHNDINIRLCNILGETIIYKTFVPDANNRIALNVSDLSMGLYLIEIEAENNLIRKRLTVSR